MKTLIQRIKQLFKPATGKPRRETRAITEAELAGRFASAPDNALWEATLTLLTERINATATDAANSQLPDREILWRVAGADALMRFLEELQEREQQARQMQQERETKNS